MSETGLTRAGEHRDHADRLLSSNRREHHDILPNKCNINDF